MNPISVKNVEKLLEGYELSTSKPNLKVYSRQMKNGAYHKLVSLTNKAHDGYLLSFVDDKLVGAYVVQSKQKHPCSKSVAREYSTLLDLINSTPKADQNRTALP